MADSTTVAEEDEEKIASGPKDTAIFRVKRKLSDDPVEALLVAHRIKKKKTGDKDEENEPVEVLFRLAGTVNKVDDSLAKMTLMSLKSGAKSKSSKPNPYNSASGQTERIRKLTRNLAIANRKMNRLKVVSSHRSAEEAENSSPEADEHPSESSHNKELFHLYDVVQEDKEAGDNSCRRLKEKSNPFESQENIILCNSVRMVRERCCMLEEGMHNLTVSGEEYVYDIYYSEEGTGPLGHILNVDAVEQEFVHGEEEEEDVYDDVDDSNDEDNWRNDYPDEDEVCADEDEEGCFQASLSSDEEDAPWKMRNILQTDDLYDSEISDPEQWSD